ncbi:MAG: 3-keto-disaccharide hydrolase [Verrucomicrobiota bacterium JB025]|nr:DUF1080 domain-containing protein [Verrucomicrobiota bacterium JB025]
MKPRNLAQTAISLAIAAPTLATAQFYGDPPDATHPWAVHDMNRPQPPVVTPAAKPGDPPSDAVVLFDGTEESFKNNWKHVRDKRKGDWIFKDGAMQCAPGAGYIRTKEEFGDCQLHIEWAAPTKVQGNSQGRGNSGVFFLDGATEIQVLDNYDNPSYADGMAGSVYGVMPPAANPLRAPGEWQTYDIIFRRPIIKNGEIIDPGSQTVLINGVVVQDSTPIEGGGGHKKRSNPKKPFPETGPLSLQDHGNPVRFRNIWYRPLRKRATDGGTDGQLTPEATTVKRAEIAAEIRKDAATKTGINQMMRLLESLCYETNDSTVKDANAMLAKFVKSVEATPADKIESRKGETKNVFGALSYLATHKRIPADHPAIKALRQIINTNGWQDKKK